MYGCAFANCVGWISCCRIYLHSSTDTLSSWCYIINLKNVNQRRDEILDEQDNDGDNIKFDLKTKLLLQLKLYWRYYV